MTEERKESMLEEGENNDTKEEEEEEQEECTECTEFTDMSTFEKWMYRKAMELSQKMDKSREKEMVYEKFLFESPNFDETLETRDCYLQVRQKVEGGKDFEIAMTYVICKCHPEALFDYVIGPYENLTKLFIEFMNFFWDYTTCPECLIGLRCKEASICKKCIPFRILSEYSEKYLKKETKQCPICMERVYASKLHCGHFIHKTCMVKLSEEDWFDDLTWQSKSLKCPLCRKLLSSHDIKNFFMAKEI